MTQKTTVYENVIRQFDKAADLMGLDPEIRKILSQTTNEIVVDFCSTLTTEYSDSLP